MLMHTWTWKGWSLKQPTKRAYLEGKTEAQHTTQETARQEEWRLQEGPLEWYVSAPPSSLAWGPGGWPSPAGARSSAARRGPGAPALLSSVVPPSDCSCRRPHSCRPRSPQSTPCWRSCAASPGCAPLSPDESQRPPSHATLYSWRRCTRLHAVCRSGWVLPSEGLQCATAIRTTIPAQLCRCHTYVALSETHSPVTSSNEHSRNQSPSHSCHSFRNQLQ